MASFQTTKRGLLLGSAALAIIPMPQEAGAAPASGPDAPVGKSLHTGWSFREVGTEAWLPATVPGTVHTDLQANGRIKDPFYRTNERDQQWIDKKDWEYRLQIELDAATLAHDHVELLFAGLDTYADVYLNDTPVLQADNMFRSWSVDIKAHAHEGENTLRIVFRSPVLEGLKRLDALGYNPPATNDQSENGGLGDKKVSVFTRKAGYHYGWDWGPRFVTLGVWRPVSLHTWNNARITDLHITQYSLSEDVAHLTAVFEIKSDRVGPAIVEIRSPNDNSIRARSEVQLVRGVNVISLPFSIGTPRLWWTNGLGEAYLYQVSGQLATGGASDHREVRIGLRTLKLIQTPDADGAGFYFELNGRPVFVKGANCIPNDSFLPRVTPEVYRRVVQSAVDTHMNMLRVWGGGIYEDDVFYDLCDAHGILVWQDFMFACSMYPGDAAFLENVRQEATENVRRLRNHPSLALWAGNNEIDSAWQNDVPNGGWGWKQNYTQSQRDEMWKAYQAIFHQILPDVVAQHDPQRSYWPSSPLAGWDGQEVRHADLANEQQSGDLHYWDVWWGQKPFSDYRTHIGRFMSEYGFQSFPELKTVQAYAQPEDYDIFSEVMQAHQRSSIGNGTIKNYMARDYKVPVDFQHFLYVGQVLQAEGIKVAMEAHRVRMPYCMGSLFWQINDCWPVASWSSIDYYGRWKAQQYFTRKSFAPLLVTARLETGLVTVNVVSDLRSDLMANLVLEVTDFHGKVWNRLEKPLTVKANSSQVAVEVLETDCLSGAAPDQVFLNARLISGQETVAETQLYLRPVKDLALPKVDIDVKVKALGQDFAIGLSATALVKNLHLSMEGGEGFFSDNYFDLLPGATTIVTFTPAKVATVTSVQTALKAMHMKMIG